MGHYFLDIKYVEPNIKFIRIYWPDIWLYLMKMSIEFIGKKVLFLIFCFSFFLHNLHFLKAKFYIFKARYSESNMYGYPVTGYSAYIYPAIPSSKYKFILLVSLQKWNSPEEKLSLKHKVQNTIINKMLSINVWHTNVF